MSENHIYKTNLKWAKERKGIESAEGLKEIEVATPPEFPFGHAGIWSPEHLFIASAEVCLMTTFLAIAHNSKLNFIEYTSEAVGYLEKESAGYLITRIEIFPTVVLEDEKLIDKTERLLEKAEQHCLISNSMKTAVTIIPKVITADQRR